MNPHHRHLPPEEIAVRREFAKVTWDRSAAWAACQARGTFDFGGFRFKVQVSGHNGWRKDHDADFWSWYAKRLYFDHVPRQECPVPKEQWPNGYAWHVWIDHRGATTCGFVLVDHYQCGFEGQPVCPLGDDCPNAGLTVDEKIIEKILQDQQGQNFEEILRKTS